MEVVSSVTLKWGPICYMRLFPSCAFLYQASELSKTILLHLGWLVDRCIFLKQVLLPQEKWYFAGKRT